MRLARGSDCDSGSFRDETWKGFCFSGLSISLLVAPGWLFGCMLLLEGCEVTYLRGSFGWKTKLSGVQPDYLSCVMCPLTHSRSLCTKQKTRSRDGRKGVRAYDTRRRRMFRPAIGLGR